MKCEYRETLKQEIIFLRSANYTFGEIATKINISRNIVAGVIWRQRNPGMWTKTIKIGQKRKWYGTAPQKAIYKVA